MSSLQEVHKTMEQGDFSAWMMDYSIISFMESLQKEKQIMVDPLSMKNYPMLPTIVTNSAASTTLFNPPPLQPPKQSFLSMSLPNSATSSPRFGPSLSMKKSKGSGSPEPPCDEASDFDHKLQHLLQEIHLRKTKSCVEA